MSDQNLKEDLEDGETQILSHANLLPNGNGDPNAATVNKLSFLGGNSHTSHSLSVLESDLRSLHEKWQAVEKIIAERDERIAVFEKDLATYRDRCTVLEDQIEALSDEKQQLTSEVNGRNAELHSLTVQCDELKSLADERETDLQKAQKGTESLQKDKRRLEKEIAEQSQKLTDTNKRIGELKAEETALRVQIQELNDYIDRRKGEWQELNDKLKAYEETISGMSDSLESHDNIVATKEGEKAELACTVMALERELAESRGKYSEKESAHQALQQSFESQAKELGNLNSETMRRSKDIERLEKKLKQRDSSIEKLRADLKEGKSNSSSLDKQLSVEKSALADLQSKLDSANKRISDLESTRKERDASAEELSATVGALRERLKTSDPTIQKQEEAIAELQQSLDTSQNNEASLRSEITTLSEKLEEVITRSADQEILLAEASAASLDSAKELKGVEEELEAQRELVQVLEAEVKKKQEDLDLLDRNVDRLHAIGSEVRDLDMQIDDIWRGKPRLAKLDMVLPGEEPIENLVSPDDMVDDNDDNDDVERAYEHLIIRENESGGQSNRQVLADGITTIGRAGTSDIRVASKYISRLHARITIDGESAVIEDAGSTNGFFVNSMQARHHVLTSGDMLEIGDCRFRYLCHKDGMEANHSRDTRRDH